MSDPFDIGDTPLDFNDTAKSTASTYNLSDEEITALTKKVANGDKDSAFRIYQYYRFVKLDAKEAKKWLKKSADLGHEVGIKNLKNYNTDQN